MNTTVWISTQVDLNGVLQLQRFHGATYRCGEAPRWITRRRVSHQSLVPRFLRLDGERTDQPPRGAKRAAVGCNREFDAPAHRRLQQRGEVISVDFAVAADCRDLLNTDEVERFGGVTLDLEAQLDCFANALVSSSREVACVW
jgi:hypothetical protein